MALRSHTRTATATSGPGRAPASDGRTAHRRRTPPPSRRRARNRHTPADELRRRAELLFGERAGERRESGHGPPESRRRADAAPENLSEEGVGEIRVRDGTQTPERAVSPGDFAEDGPGWRERLGTALRERMPVWLQVRCGMERRGVVALAVLLAVAAVFAVQHFWSGRTQPVRAPQVVRAQAPFGADDGAGGGEHTGDGATGADAAGTPGGSGATAGTAGTTAGSAPGAAGAQIVVDVSGKVRNPGIHRLPAGSRVADALRAAGGVRPGTGIEGLNRARVLMDGEQVVVGAPAPAPMPGAGGVSGSGSAGGSSGAAGGPATPISLNTATADQLDTLPGVGPVLAQHIIDYRTEHGGYRSVDELRQVNGIGDRRFADLRNLVRP
ncbi:ComEA family DNA-binding protein [Streptomyces sp. NPDC046805]|uniref:ComEA family DNA-binding protein n=1 Tax=Streptomyces sp. NPDC046805 TaxID=3155134 RepID=UPI0033DD1A21